MKASEIQKKIKKYCDIEKIYYNKTIRMAHAGFPDIICVVNSIPLFFEVKTKRDRLSPLQKATIKVMNKKKEIAFVISSLDEFKKIVEKYVDFTDNIS